MQHSKQGALIVVSNKLEVVFAQVNPQILQIPQVSNHSASLFFPYENIRPRKMASILVSSRRGGKVHDRKK